MRRVDVIVTMGALHRQPMSVPPWEMPVLQLVHGGPDNVEVIGESRCNLPVPDVADEFARLIRRYGRNKETQVPRAEEAFGAGSMGLDRLAQLMAEDLEEQAEIDGAKDAHAEAQRAVAAGAARDLIAGTEPTAGQATQGQAAAQESQRARGGTKRNASE